MKKKAKIKARSKTNQPATKIESLNRPGTGPLHYGYLAFWQ